MDWEEAADGDQFDGTILVFAYATEFHFRGFRDSNQCLKSCKAAQPESTAWSPFSVQLRSVPEF